MGWAYGIDFRQRVVDAIEGGMTRREAAAWFCVAVSPAGNWHRRWRATGSAAPDIDIHEIAERLAAELDVRATRSTVWLFFEMCGITFKKRRRMPRNRAATM